MSTSSVGNLSFGNEEREFFVWVDPNVWLVKNNLGMVGSFSGGPSSPGDDVPSKLPFQPNSERHPLIMTPFHTGLISWYMMDYNLELQRHRQFPHHPSRFYALYLLQSREDAERYRESHQSHVAGRILKRCVTIGDYKYSVHDSSWIEFLRVSHMLDSDTIDNVGDEYWSGQTVEGKDLRSMGVPWVKPISPEVLFYGTVNFPNRDLSASD